jgi:hypothetical protein
MQSKGLRSGNYDFSAQGIAPEYYNVCFGDSGGPVMVLDEGTWKLAGINSHIYDTTRCERSGAGFTLVPAYLDWIQSAQNRAQALKAANSKPIEMPHPVDEASEDFINFVKDCETATPGSDLEHTYSILMAFTKQKTCIDTARLALGLTFLDFTYTNSTALGILESQGYGYTYSLYEVGEVARTKITNAQPFAYLSNLLSLTLDGHAIADLTPLAQMKSLTYLSLASNGFTPTQMQALKDINGLALLNLSGNSISDGSVLQGLKSLSWLFLQSTNLRDLRPLQGLTNLVTLRADSNQITDLSPLSGLTRLQILSLSQNSITDVSPLANLKALLLLTLNYNALTDISSLSSLSNLAYLSVQGNYQLTSKRCPVPEPSGKKICYF